MSKKIKLKTNTIPDDIIKEYTPSVKKLVNQLRKLILNAVPEVYETALPGWHAIGFRHPDGGHFCAVFPLQDSVKLYFEYGAYLKDLDKILEGNTKQVRYITFKKISDIQEKLLKKLVQQAVLYLTNRK
jgi:hypothetical protein